ncbi:ATP-binding protein [Candidatus Peregrinibacteria bacterium]|nr:ATP-binding protein [Candidatus Peregrinibacteria bacterium]
MGTLEQRELGQVLANLLKIRQGTPDLLSNRESSQLEFKTSFDLASGPHYARSMAGFANNEGGFLVFGVQNAPRKVTGISRERFEAVDPVKITDLLGSYFSPEIQWDFGTIELVGVTIGFIYTYETTEKPVVATKTSGREIRESSVYYRYRGKTTFIGYPELREIIEQRLDRERKAWLQHLQTIGKSGPTRVGIIDTVQGKVFGAGAPFLIDEKLLRQLKFVRQGSFKETGGTPSLRLIGDLRAVEGVSVEKIVHTGIHYDDLVTAFLAQRPLDKEDGKSYLIECAHQTTPFTPVLYFCSQAGLTREQAVSLLEAERTSLRYTTRYLKKRLEQTTNISPGGRIADRPTWLRISNSRELLELIGKEGTALQKRSAIFAALQQYPAFVRDIGVELPPSRLFEAISNLTRKDIERAKTEVLGCLLDFFNQRFQSLESSEKSLFRKAVVCVEEQLYR